ncbi:MAG: hypothetical protein ACYC8W_07725 [Candidatus Tyrphobacter sp.]
MKNTNTTRQEKRAQQRQNRRAKVKATRNRRPEKQRELYLLGYNNDGAFIAYTNDIQETIASIRRDGGFNIVTLAKRQGSESEFIAISSLLQAEVQREDANVYPIYFAGFGQEAADKLGRYIGFDMDREDADNMTDHAHTGIHVTYTDGTELTTHDARIISLICKIAMAQTENDDQSPPVVASFRTTCCGEAVELANVDGGKALRRWFRARGGESNSATPQAFVCEECGTATVMFNDDAVGRLCADCDGHPTAKVA